MARARPGLVLVGLAAALAGCGGGARYANRPGPPATVFIAAAITDRGVSLSRHQLGAGLVRLVVTNLTGVSQQLVVQSRGGSSFVEETAPINPQDTAELKAELGSGSYVVMVRDAGVKAAVLAVGSRGRTSEDQLSLP
jgi:hypothetical protein